MMAHPLLLIMFFTGCMAQSDHILFPPCPAFFSTVLGVLYKSTVSEISYFLRLE